MKRYQTTSLMLMLAAAAGLAAAGPEESDKQDKSLLKGPEVRQTTTQQSHRALTDATDPAMNTMTDKPSKAQQDKDTNAQHPKAPTLEQEPAEFREYAMAIRRLNDSGVDPAVALTDTQRRDLREIMMTNRAQMRQFQTDNRDRFRELRLAAGLGKAPEAKPGDPSPSPEQTAKAREAFHHFLETAPPNIEALARIKQLLSDEQNKLVGEQIMVMRQQRIDKANQPNDKEAQTRARQGNPPGADKGPRAINRPMNRNTARRGQAKRQRNNKTNDRPKPPADD